eukprot:131634_1
MGRVSFLGEPAAEQRFWLAKHPWRGGLRRNGTCTPFFLLKLESLRVEVRAIVAGGGSNGAHEGTRAAAVQRYLPLPDLGLGLLGDGVDVGTAGEDVEGELGLDLALHHGVVGLERGHVDADVERAVGVGELGHGVLDERGAGIDETHIADGPHKHDALDVAAALLLAGDGSEEREHGGDADAAGDEDGGFHLLEGDLEGAVGTLEEAQLEGFLLV